MRICQLADDGVLASADSLSTQRYGVAPHPALRQPLKASPQLPKALWRGMPTMVISPQGRTMPLEEAINLVSFLSATDKGGPACLFQLYIVCKA